MADLDRNTQLALLFSGVMVAKADKLIDVSFNDDDGNASLVNRGTLTATGTFEGDAAYSADVNPTNDVGYSGYFNGDTGAATDAANFGPLSGLGNLSEMTVTAWVKVKTQTTSTLLGNADIVPGGTYKGFALRMVSNGEIRGVANSAALAWSGYAPPVGEWVFVAMTYDSDPLYTRYYHGDGSSLSTDTANNTTDGGVIGISPKDFLVGDEPEAASESFDGLIDNVRVYNTVLSESELTTVMQTTDVSNPPADDPPLLEVDFNDDAANPSLVSRGALTATGTFQGDGFYAGDFNPTNGAGFSGYFNGDTGAATDAANFGPLTWLGNLSEITVTAWVKVNTQTECTLLGNADLVSGGTYKGFALRMVSNGEIRGVANSIGLAWSGYAPPVGEWVFIAMTYDSNPLYTRYYHGDGSSLSTDTANNTTDGGVIGVSPKDFLVGDEPEVASESFDGLIDNVRIYRRVLSSSELTTVMQTTDVSSTLDASPLFQLDFNDDTQEPAASLVSRGLFNATGTFEGDGAYSDDVNQINRGGYSGYFNGDTGAATDAANFGPLTWLGNLPEITVTAWVKVNTQTECTLLGNADIVPGGTYKGFALRMVSNGQIRGVANSATLAWSGYAPPVGEWVFIAMTYDSDPLYTRYYHGDGSSLSTDTAQNTSNGGIIGVSPKDFLIGDEPEAASESFDGLIDNVRVYNIVLSESQLTSVMKEQDWTPPAGTIIIMR